MLGFTVLFIPDSTMHLLCRHNMQKIPNSTYTAWKRSSAWPPFLEAGEGSRGASWGANRLPVRLRAGFFFSLGRRLQENPDGARRGGNQALRAQLSHRARDLLQGSPREAAAWAGSARWALAWAEREVEPETGRLKPEHPWACASSEPSAGDRAVFLRHRRP